MKRLYCTNIGTNGNVWTAYSSLTLNHSVFSPKWFLRGMVHGLRVLCVRYLSVYAPGQIFWPIYLCGVSQGTGGWGTRSQKGSWSSLLCPYIQHPTLRVCHWHLSHLNANYNLIYLKLISNTFDEGSCLTVFLNFLCLPSSFITPDKKHQSRKPSCWACGMLAHLNKNRHKRSMVFSNKSILTSTYPIKVTFE